MRIRFRRRVVLMRRILTITRRSRRLSLTHVVHLMRVRRAAWMLLESRLPLRERGIARRRRRVSHERTPVRWRAVSSPWRTARIALHAETILPFGMVALPRRRLIVSRPAVASTIGGHRAALLLFCRIRSRLWIAANSTVCSTIGYDRATLLLPRGIRGWLWIAPNSAIGSAIGYDRTAL